MLMKLVDLRLVANTQMLDTRLINGSLYNMPNAAKSSSEAFDNFLDSEWAELEQAEPRAIPGPETYESFADPSPWQEAIDFYRAAFSFVWVCSQYGTQLHGCC
jgi:hypothetical protein